MLLVVSAEFAVLEGCSGRTILAFGVEESRLDVLQLVGVDVASLWLVDVERCRRKSARSGKSQEKDSSGGKSAVIVFQDCRFSLFVSDVFAFASCRRVVWA